MTDKVIGAYRVLRFLGKGGMGRVYLARNRRGGPPVVLKILRPSRARDPEARAMFMHEARLGASLSHPNVVRLLDFGEADGRMYLVMEHVDGASLSEIRRQLDRLPLDAALEIVAQVAGALSHAHMLADAFGRPLSIVHRDVSPENILISSQGQVKLIDFGIARSTAQDHRTELGIVKGKLGYMAPEQLHGGVDPRTDLFALGVVLHELINHERLFRRENHAATVSAILFEEIAPLRLPVHAARVLSPIVERATARRRDERYVDARSFETDVRRAMRLLGMDPDTSRARLAEIVDRADNLFLPCPEPDVTSPRVAVAAEPWDSAVDTAPWVGDIPELASETEVAPVSGRIPATTERMRFGAVLASFLLVLLLATWGRAAGLDVTRHAGPPPLPPAQVATAAAPESAAGEPAREDGATPGPVDIVSGAAIWFEAEDPRSRPKRRSAGRQTARPLVERAQGRWLLGWDGELVRMADDGRPRMQGIDPDDDGPRARRHVQSGGPLQGPQLVHDPLGLHVQM